MKQIFHLGFLAASMILIAMPCKASDNSSKATSNNTTITTASVPVPPPDSAQELKSDTTIGCSSNRYSTEQSPKEVINYYDAQLKSNGWKITSKGGGGSSYGGGAGLSAEKSGQYININAGGGGGSDTYFTVCFGSDKKAVRNCNRNND